MIGFKLNSAGDIEASGGKISLLSTVQEAVRQRLEIKLRTYAGEWFLDTTYGIPYRQQIIGKGLSKPEIDALYIDVINQDPDVQRIVYFNSTYSPLTREYDTSFEVRVADELLRVDTLKQTPAEEIEYPVPDGSQLTPSCDAFVVGSYICDLHQIVHCDLPISGEYTWIYDSGEAYVDLDYVDWDYVADTAGLGDDCVRYYATGYASYGYVKYDCKDTDWSFAEDNSGITFPSEGGIIQPPIPPIQPSPSLPVITQNLPLVYDAYGDEDIDFVIAATSSTALTYQWQILQEGSSVWQKIEIPSQPYYSFSMRTNLDNSRIRCLVTNAAGTVITNEVKLNLAEMDYLKLVGGGFVIPSITVDTSITTTTMPYIIIERLQGMPIPDIVVQTIKEPIGTVRNDYVVALIEDNGVKSTHRAFITDLEPSSSYFATLTATSNDVVLVDSVSISTI